MSIEGCGDHSCVVRKPIGMGTNGGCQCKANILRARIGELEPELASRLHDLAKMTTFRNELMDEAERLEAEGKRLRGDLDDATLAGTPYARQRDEMNALTLRIAELEAERAALAATVARFTRVVTLTRETLAAGDELEFAVPVVPIWLNHIIDRHVTLDDLLVPVPLRLDAAYGARLLAAERYCEAKLAWLRHTTDCDPCTAASMRWGSPMFADECEEGKRLFDARGHTWTACLTLANNAAAAEGADTEEGEDG